MMRGDGLQTGFRPSKADDKAASMYMLSETGSVYVRQASAAQSALPEPSSSNLTPMPARFTMPKRTACKKSSIVYKKDLAGKRQGLFAYI